MDNTRNNKAKENREYLWSLRDTLKAADIGAVEQEHDIEIEQDDGLTNLATLVPDEVIYNVNDYETRQFDGCLLFGDVSGFTDLSEKYSKTGGGSSRLTQVLNDYIGGMVQEILSRNGDIFKFSGDAFLALWKITPSLSIPDAIHQALDSALMIQENLGVYRTDVGVIIKVKLAIAFGDIYFSLIGDKDNSHYLMSGPSLWDIKKAEEKAIAGQVICTRDAWRYVTPSDYLYEDLDNFLVKVFGTGPTWKSLSQTNISRNRTRGASWVFDDNNIMPFTRSLALEEEYGLRLSVNYAAKNNMGESLSQFTLPPIMKSIKLNEPLDSLTEVRHVSVVFMNIVFKQQSSPVEIIKFADSIYKIVCKYAKDMNGCVNKVNNFDKDLLVLVIFGLRGFKTKLDSQTALKYAYICQNEISLLENTVSVSVGVTTGITYCGVLGHPLRKEYTVISLTVNKAARLMMAYPGKVTCDKETFLQSKLDAKNFILQTFKYLKGIGNPGPVYEFVQLQHKHTFNNVFPNYPLLSRDSELQLYKDYIDDIIKFNKISPDCNMLVYQGSIRQGKTRLLQELMLISPKSLPLSLIALAETDIHIPYILIKILILVSIGLSENSTKEERKIKLAQRLDHLDVKQVYCFLNEAFDVDFIETDFYHSLTPQRRDEIVVKLFKQLFLSVFSTGKPWVIFIDNAEYIDKKSSNLLKILMQFNLVFFVVTIDFSHFVSTSAKYILENTSNIKVIQLSDIDKWYRIGLVCQILSVQGISPEIEIIINTCPQGGNPGWLENYALILVHSGNLKILSTNRKHAIENGLILAPLYMLYRMSEQNTTVYKQMLEDQSHNHKIDRTYNNERWKIYMDSCGDNVTKMKEFFDNTCKSDAKINICIIGDQSSIENLRPEEIIDATFMKTFDSLTSHEQLVLKCSSVLGDTFYKRMLNYVMPSLSSVMVRNTCLAVQKLFEKGLIVCGRTKFTTKYQGVGVNLSVMSANKEELKCECTDLFIHESCSNLPKYASCGYMRFVSSNIRSATYSLLTDNQKKEFHNKAIRYIEKETRKCKFCGSGYFETIKENQSYIDVVKSEKRVNKFERRTLIRRKTESETLGVQFTDSSVDMTRLSSSDSQLRKRHFLLSSASEGRINSQDERSPSITSAFGKIIIRQLKESQSLVRTFSNMDFSYCTCSLILAGAFFQIIEHCQGSENNEKLLLSITEYTYVCIDNENYLGAMEALQKGLDILNDPSKHIFQMKWEVEVKKAKMYCLLGYSLLKLEHYEESYKYLTKALKLYGFSYPTSISRKIFKNRLHYRLLIYLYVYPNIYKRVMQSADTDFYNDLCECTGFLCNYFITMKNWEEAEFTALWCFALAIKSYTRFIRICVAYKNLIYIFQHFGRYKICSDLEVYALHLCHLKKKITSASDLKAITQLYQLIFKQRIIRAQLDDAITIGYITWRTAVSINLFIIMDELLPLMFYILLLKLQLNECINMLQEMNCITYENINVKTWFNSCCIIFQLECGATVIPYKEIEYYCLNPYMFNKAEEKYRIFVVLWLWCLRNKKFSGARYWQEFIWDFEFKKNDSLTNLITALYFLEGLLLFLSYKLDKKNYDDSREATKRIKKFFVLLKSEIENYKIILPRYYHLCGYYQVIKDSKNYSSAIRHLMIAKQYAEKQDNKVELSWIQFTIDVWKDNISNSQKHLWRSSCETGNEYDYHDIEITGTLYHYPLEPPTYV